ncbi:chloroplast import apparatus 2 [Striga asiatica]|uniref:Chloroplast import apparatus 2 n=1 Tax=Striga asiatica TaxID=4170 RepID=A0A5A7RAM4_STRAF|nr:chloroplast import apparatus 2 [Striga asiatica]
MTSLPSHPPTACGHHHEQAPPKAPQIQQLSSTHNPFLSTTDPANPRGRKWLLVAPRNQMTCCPALRQVVGAQLHHRLALNRGGSNRFGSIQRVMTTNKWLKLVIHQQFPESPAGGFRQTYAKHHGPTTGLTLPDTWQKKAHLWSRGQVNGARVQRLPPTKIGQLVDRKTGPLGYSQLPVKLQPLGPVSVSWARKRPAREPVHSAHGTSNAQCVPVEPIFERWVHELRAGVDRKGQTETTVERSNVERLHP